MGCIAAKFNLGDCPPSIKTADDACLMTEKRDVMPGSQKPWRETSAPFDKKIQRMHPDEAKLYFLDRYKLLAADR